MTAISHRGEELRRSREGGYEKPRQDLWRLIPTSAGRILDLGCASGALGAAIKRRQHAVVIGVELLEEYANDARAVLDDVITGDAESVLASNEHRERLGSFDCVIAADVLEHLRDPWQALRNAAGMLEPGGTVVVSVPNVRFWETLWHVGVRGRWPRRDVGLFDGTHLRWFGRADARELVEQAGLEVVHIRGQYKLKTHAGKIDRVLWRLLRALPIRDFFAYQYALVGIKRPSTG